MWRHRKWAEGRSRLRRCKAASRTGCRLRDEMVWEGIRGGDGDLGSDDRGGG